jgi:hypothetical protein
LCLSLGALLSISAGQDNSWDLRNYHIYNAVRLLDRRIDLDFFPDDKHSALNPILDFIYVLLGRGPLQDYPRVLAALMGFWYGIVVFVTLSITRLILTPFSSKEQRLLVPFTLIMTLTGGMTLSQIGTTSNDIAIAALILIGLYFILRGYEQKPENCMPYIIGGVFFGLAAGAKLTGLIYAPALLIALLLTVPKSILYRASLSFCGAWLVGFLVSFAPWATLLIVRYGNPTFPMLNGIFKSPLAPALNLMDERFFPRDIWQWVAYPLFWAWNKSNHLVYEFDFRDPRLALTYGALILFTIVKLLGVYFSRQDNRATALSLPFRASEKLILFFVVFSYLGWLVTTSILRYAIPLEILSGLVLVIILMRLQIFSRTRLIILSASCLFSLTLTQYTSWGHCAFGSKVFNVDMSQTKPHTLFLGLYEPVAYLAAFTPPETDARFVGIGFVSYLQGWPLGDVGKQLIETHQGPFVVLLREDKRPYLKLLTSFGLSEDVSNCHQISSNLEAAENLPLLACEVSRL